MKFFNFIYNLILLVFTPDPPSEVEKDKEIEYETKTWGRK